MLRLNLWSSLTLGNASNCICFAVIRKKDRQLNKIACTDAEIRAVLEFWIKLAPPDLLLQLAATMLKIQQLLGPSNQHHSTLVDPNVVKNYFKDCFFVSVVIRNHPKLRDKLVAKCHSTIHEELLKFLLRTTMLETMAVSCDDLEVTQLEEEDPHFLASVIRKEIFAITGCTASAGISGNLLILALPLEMLNQMVNATSHLRRYMITCMNFQLRHFQFQLNLVVYATPSALANHEHSGEIPGAWATYQLVNAETLQTPAVVGCTYAGYSSTNYSIISSIVVSDAGAFADATTTRDLAICAAVADVANAVADVIDDVENITATNISTGSSRVVGADFSLNGNDVIEARDIVLTGISKNGNSSDNVHGFSSDPRAGGWALVSLSSKFVTDVFSLDGQDELNFLLLGQSAITMH
ncbi:DNA-directed DNA polymerase [Actinidia rufa]|uniref:DNA-directed DNA polymerase n=1 Tax=Actinidia rufa TaxID=165716 RepID=A0A7J0H1R6_9ERIC|nr:DNA-directed DNA polymerase [Actinidia rufa]